MKNILQSLKVVKKKLKGKFDYEQMEQDIKNVSAYLKKLFS